jgi:hypothetical protein
MGEDLPVPRAEFPADTICQQQPGQHGAWPAAGTSAGGTLGTHSGNSRRSAPPTPPSPSPATPRATAYAALPRVKDD